MPAIANSLALSATYKPINLILPYSIILKGRNRLLRISLMFNKYTNCRASSSAITHLPSFLQHKFGSTAVGILVGDVVYKNDEELMRDATIKSDEEYYVLYEDYTPSYTESITVPPMYHDARTSLEGKHLPGYADPSVTGQLRPAYFEELVYYPVVPLVRKTFTVKMSFGRRVSLTLSNHCTDHADNFRHLLYVKAGYKAQGIVTADGTVYRNDELLFSDEIEDGGAYKLVTNSSGYSLTAPATERRPTPTPTPTATAARSSSRDNLDLGIRRISSNASRGVSRVTSRTSIGSRERPIASGVRAK